MSVSAVPKISSQSVGPVPKAGNSPVKFKSKLSLPFGAYARADDPEINDQEEKKENSPKIIDRENDYSDLQNTTKPEIFRLLQKYHFQDFFQLSLSQNDLKLAAVIKKNRKLRGISLSLPLSNQYTENNDFINQVKDHYLHTNWLMKEAPGKSYTGIL